MSSGYGLGGGPGRCFPFWQEVLACYVTSTSSPDPTAAAAGKRACQPVLEDYYECLHHKKEATKIRALQTAYRRQEQQQQQGPAAVENRPQPGEIRRLGLLEGVSVEEKYLRPAPLIPRVGGNGVA